MPNALRKKAALALAITSALAGCGSSSDSNKQPVENRVIYVSPAGGGEGSAASPTDLAAALEMASRGDTLRILAGTYDNLPLPISISIEELTLEGEGADASIWLLDDSVSACSLIDLTARNLRLTGLGIDASVLTLAPDNCANPTLLRAEADGLTLSNLSLAGGNPLPTPGSLGLPEGNAYNLLAVSDVEGLVATDLKLLNAPRHAMMVSRATGDIAVDRVAVENAGYRGIYLTDSGGYIEVVNNTVHGVVNEGIYLRDVTGEVNILQNEVTDVRYRPTVAGGSGIEGGIVHTNFEGTVVTVLRMNTVDIDPQGHNRALSGEPLLDIDGIEVNMFGTARGYALVEDNVVRNTDDDGIDSDTADTAELDIVIRNNILTNIQDRSISFVAAGQGVVRGLIEGNTITGPTVLLDNDDVDADGIGIRPREASNVNLTVRNNTVNRPGRKGIDINMNRGAGDTGPVNNARAVFRFEANTVTDAGQRALDVQLEDTAEATGVLINNTVSGAAEDGIRVRSGAGDNDSVVQTTTLSVAVIDNQVTDSSTGGDAGIFARVQRDARLCLTLTGNESRNPGADRDYFLRSQQNSVLELQGLTAAMAAADPSAPLRTALVAAGNSGRDAEFPARVQNNDVEIPTQACSFVAAELMPALPELP
ncbi:right-handed parallel beta-helix repeat-containing protein [Alkalilimnicola ehrlichii]|nr:right-handed parallel beta-helix repeat-containing protein [Alkalilimnicola ehrlichii]